MGQVGNERAQRKELVNGKIELITQCEQLGEKRMKIHEYRLRNM